MMCLWWVTLAAGLGAGARAQYPRPMCARDQGAHCIGYSDYFFVVKGVEVTYEFLDGDFFALECPGLDLDEQALPRFNPALRVLEVKLDRCWPRAGSYAAALSALNVTASESPAHTYFVELKLSKVKDFDVNVLAIMPTLRSLYISDTTLTSADFARLPVGLERLYIRNTRTGHVSAASLSRLPGLSELTVFDSEPMDVEPAGNLTALVINSLATSVNLSLPNTLSSLELRNWAARHPEPWRSCAGLDYLIVGQFAAEVLPDDWLARCVNLYSLQLLGAKDLSLLAAGALRGTTTLEEVKIWGSALEALPAGLLDDATALRRLDVSHNRLHTLPSDIFQKSKLLSRLDLSFNNLTSSVLSALGYATALTELNLDENISLDACYSPTHASSPLSNLKNLAVLTLQATGTQCVCASWRQLPRLKRLVLSDTNVTRLNYTDFQFNTTVDITIVLAADGLSLRREDYDAATAAGPTISLDLRGVLHCDCELYWVAAALRLLDTRLRQEGGICEDGRKLDRVPLDDLLCAVPGPCIEDCTCSAREDVAGRVLRLDCSTAGLSRVPRLEARAMLQYTGDEPVQLDLRLAGNHIDQLSPEDLPTELAVLDVRDNALRVIDARTVAALVSRAGRRVLLAGNPLDCSCRSATALAAMRAHTDLFTDAAHATCPDGTLLALAAPPLCEDERTEDLDNVPERVLNSTTEGVLQYTTNAFAAESMTVDTSEGVMTTSQVELTTTGGGLQNNNNVTTIVPDSAREGVSILTLSAAAVGALVLVLALVVAVVVLRRRLRAAMLSQPPEVLQLQRRRPEPDEWAYDAFVSFAHEDEAVVRELVERLEGGAAPLRLCVHYRDWVPGGWIPAQIAASVRVSRRTVAVVSEAFLRSKWARAEFREAYAAALEDTEPRLVLVLLDDPAQLQLDSELFAYVSGNTYVRWGDPWFWRKLRRALPAPRVLPAAESRAVLTSPPAGTLDTPEAGVVGRVVRA